MTAFPLLKPLCDATKQSLHPTELSADDRLHISLDDDASNFIVQAQSVKTYDYDGKTFPYAATRNANYNWTRKVPERKELGSGKWRIATTDFTALIIHHTWSDGQIVWEDENARTIYQYLLMRFLVQTKSSLMAARFKIEKEIPAMPSDFVENTAMPLAPYQKVALMACLEQESYALFMQQGTGKTPVAIARICLEAQRTKTGKYGTPHMMRVLIIAPKQVRMNWQNEIDRFAVVPGKVGILRGNEVDRINTIIDVVRDEEDCAFAAAICSYAIIERSWEALSRVPWDLVILDESHYIKSHRTKRSTKARELGTLCKRRMILTGTPITNTIFDLWAQFEFLDAGLSGFVSFKHFRHFYGSFARRAENNGDVLMGFKNIPLIQERLARLAFTITKKDANLSLPDKMFDVYEVAMTKKQAKAYVQLRNMLAIEIKEQLENGDEIRKEMTVENILTKLLRLAQITSGHVRWDGGVVEQIDKINPKVDGVIEMIRQDRETDPKSKTIVWATFVEDIRIVCQRLQDEGINFTAYHKVAPKEFRSADAGESAKIFNGIPECSVLVANPASGGEGLNLVGYDWENPDKYDTNCDHEIFFSQNWSAVQRSQAEDRAHRRGTRNKVRITDLVVPGTIDEEIRVRVTEKRQMAMQIQNLKDMLGRILSDLKLDD